MTMANDAERADNARQRGNEFYKSNRVNDAITAYKLASTLAPSDPAPLSNLSAATFEAGNYDRCVEFGHRALTLLEDENHEDPRIQKLLIRLIKAKLYLSDPNGVLPLIEKLAPGQEKEALQSATDRMATAHLALDSKELLWNALFNLPRYRPHLNSDRCYFPVGHDEATSQYNKILQRTTKDAQVVSFLFCGIGDARNLFQTIFEYCGSNFEPNQIESNQKLHCTILDNKPAMICRVIIMLALLDDLSRIMGASHRKQGDLTDEECDQLLEAQTVLSYVFATQVMPVYAWDRLYTTMGRILDCFEKKEQPIPWVHIPTEVQAAMRPTLESWHQLPSGPYATPRFRGLTSQHRIEQAMFGISMMAQNNVHVPGVLEQPLPHLKFDQRVYSDFSIILPPPALLNERDPELASMVHDYQNGDESVKLRMNAHIDSKWRSNMTLVDTMWEEEFVAPGAIPTPYLSFTPFEAVDRLMSAMGLPESDEDTLLSLAALYFSAVAGAISILGRRLMVDVCVGEMADVLERIQYQSLHRSQESVPEGSLVPLKSPNKYHVIHMSNIPDYVGGSLTSFLYGAPLLECGAGTGLGSCVLRNPEQFKDMRQFLSEYLIMYDPKLIESHFQLKLSLENSEDIPGPMPLLGYFRWERVVQKPLTFEQLMPQNKLIHWLHAHFLKLCLPSSRPGGAQKLVYAPLNMTAFLRLLVHVSGLGYPAHWLSNLIGSILAGEIITTARPPTQMVLTPNDVDVVHPTQKICTRPWVLELATMIALWQHILPFGLLMTSSVPQVRDIAQYSISCPNVEPWESRIPHCMLVFYDKQRFGKPPRVLRNLLKGSAPDSDAIKEEGVRVMSTFIWKEKIKEVTFWMAEDSFDEMVKGQWRMYVWRIDSWEREGKPVNLGQTDVRKKAWGEWENPPSLV